MAWTAPTIRATADLITASIWNTDIVNDLLAAFPAGVTYTPNTPAITGAGGNPVLNNGFANGRYLQVGKLVHYYGRVVFGSTSTFGSGAYRISVPINNAAQLGSDPIGSAWLIDSSANNYAAPGVQWDGTAATYFIFRYPAAWPAGTLTDVTSIAPWTWAQSDEIHWNVVYEGV